MSVADIDRLAEVSLQVIERHNFGYDFGAYRDGLWHLRNLEAAPDRVILQNDSIWFPLCASDDTLGRLEAHPAEICGPKYETFANRVRNQFLHSYLIRINGHLFSDERFWKYWDNLKLTNIKTDVVRYGEMGFSATMEDAGITVAGLMTSEDVKAAFHGMKMDEIQKLVEFEKLVDESQSDEMVALLAAAIAGQPLTSVTLERRRYIPTVHPLISVGKLGINFAKKDRHHNYSVWRREFLKFADAAPDDHFSATILDEMRHWDD